MIFYKLIFFYKLFYFQGKEGEYSHIDEIITHDPKNTQNFIKRLLKCGVFVFDTTLDPTEIQEARFVLNSE